MAASGVEEESGNNMKIIKFKRDSRKNWIKKVNGVIIDYGWEIALSEKELWKKLNGEMAEIIMPEKNLIIRLYRKIFPLKCIEAKADGTVYTLNSEII